MVLCLTHKHFLLVLEIKGPYLVICHKAGGCRVWVLAPGHWMQRGI